MRVFNDEMDARLRDLHAAATEGDEVRARFAPAFTAPMGGLPDRLVVSIPATGREFTLELPMAAMVADQLEANGLPEPAAVLRSHD